MSDRLIALYLILIASNVAAILWALAERADRDVEQAKRIRAEAELKRLLDGWPWGQ